LSSHGLFAELLNDQLEAYSECRLLAPYAFFSIAAAKEG